uniref:NADH-ubiquinone oxidoreductase chain 4 n=1 Tax=Amblyomma latum TaxID=34617 RepID=A0A977TPV5_9ACAR|nr:NADH dehydrogenase subunit 4 [Amblyomma latum]UXX50168.1 NADH dehydrogenase subunit 4 [Amblyomma latum]
MLINVFMSFLIMWLCFFFKTFEVLLMIILMMIFAFFQILNSYEIMIMSQFNLDLMSNLLILLTIWISFLMIMASFFKKVSLNKSFLFYVSMMMFLLIMSFSVSNLMIFYFFFEASLIPIVMLIYNWGNQPERLQAGFYMLMYTIFGSFPMFVVILKYLGKMMSLNYIYMDWLTGFLGIFSIFIMMGFLVKIPMFMFHLWLPKAHVEAPISGSMILAAVLLKLGIYGIFRFKMMMMKYLIMYFEIFVSISLWGSVMISIFCLYQIDIKSLIAYSSICHMGIVLSGTMTFSFLSSLGSLLLMIGHGLCSSGLFCLANFIYERTFTRSMILLKGLKSIFPSLALWWFLFSIINMSAPMTMNLLGELLLSVSILKMSIFFSISIMLMIFMSACYSVYMYSYINHGQGWVLWSCNLITLREYNLLYLHILPGILWIMKFSLFCKWI